MQPQPPQPQSPNYTGAVLGGRYQLTDILGRGGWGVVYAGVQQDLGRKVAVKILDGDKLADSQGLARFMREARAAAALGHPNIVQVTDFQTNPGEPAFLVMEHLTGGTLGRLLRGQCPLPAPRVCAIAHQVLSALDVAHRAGIVHRDVKPDNIFLVSTSGAADFVKLLDFGIAKLVSDTSRLTESNAMLGTPVFMAPEQVKGGAIEAQADLYALGATMYYALSGKYPHDAESAHALLYAVANSKPMPLAQRDASIDPNLSAVIERAMETDPRARWASAAEMRSAIEPWVTPRLGMGTTPPPNARSGMPPTPPSPNGPGLGTSVDTILSSPTHGTAAPSFPHPPFPGSMPAPQRSSGSRGLVVALVLALVALLVVIGGGGFYVYMNRESLASATPAPSAASSATKSPATAMPATTPAATPAATPASATTSSGGAAAPTAPPRPTRAPDAGAPPPSVVDAGAPPPGQRMTGRTPRITGGGGFEGMTFAEVRVQIGKIMPSIAACHAATELDPPRHEDPGYILDISPAGDVTSIRMWSEAHPKHDACMKALLLKTKWPPTTRGYKGAKIFFAAPIGQ